MSLKPAAKQSPLFGAARRGAATLAWDAEAGMKARHAIAEMRSV